MPMRLHMIEDGPAIAATRAARETKRDQPPAGRCRLCITKLLPVAHARAASRSRLERKPYLTNHIQDTE